MTSGGDIGGRALALTAGCGTMAPAPQPRASGESPRAAAAPAPAPTLPIEMPASTVASPCIDVCSIDPRTGWCEGCLRTIDEIAAWGVLNDAQKREVWKLLPQRRAAVADPTPAPRPR